MEIVNFILVTNDVNFHIALSIFLFEWAKLVKIEIECNLIKLDFSIILKGESNAGYPQTKVLSSQQVQQVDLSSVSESITYYVKELALMTR